MNAQQQTETRTSPSDDRGAPAPAERTKVRPAASEKWKPMRELKRSALAAVLQALGLGALYTLPAGVIAALVAVAYLILKADGIDAGSKIVGVTNVALALAILGVATLLTRRHDHAESGKEQPDLPADD